MNMPEIKPAECGKNIEIRAKIDGLTKPVGSLGVMEEIACRLSSIQNTICPKISKKRVYVFASDHGVAQEGVSAYPQDVTHSMVLNFLNGGAAINVFSRHVGAEVFVVDAGVKTDIDANGAAKNLILKKVGYSTKSILKTESMTKDEARVSIENGRELARKAYSEKTDIIVIGDMGIGNTTIATAIAAACGLDINAVVDIGTRIDQSTLEHKAKIIREALRLHKPDINSPLEILQKVGGFCIGEMTGMMLEAASLSMPVVLDGYPVTSAALLAYKFNPNVRDFLFAGHCSAVKGHKVMLEYLGLEPILNLKMRLGEGTGGVLALSIIEAAVKMMNEMATFESANVSKGNEKLS